YVEELKKQLKKTKNPEEAEELKNSLLNRFLTCDAAEIRKQALMEEYNSLKESGKLSSFLTNGGRRMQQRITDTCLIGETMPQINKRERVRESIAFRFMPRIEMKMS
ncbi:hypothetical protein IGI04_032465, partial [Brassica rapa subsp. trilocularis]